MENASTPSTYGAPFSDEEPIIDPTTQESAVQHNRLVLDVAQLTRTAHKIYLEFPTVSSDGSTPTLTRTIYGNSSSYYPTSVTRTGVGTYSIIYPSSFTNDYGDAENVSFSHANGEVVSTTVFGHVQCTCSGLTITVKVLNSSLSAVDLTAGTTIGVYAYL